ncbi:MAG: hypothetical protein ACIAQZ_12280 [Sedimentisphaeraceae bacterium JB056]
MAIELNTPEDLYSVVGVRSYTLDDDYILGANIDFKYATLGDGTSAWFDEQRPCSEYGSGTGVLKWTPRLLNGRFISVSIKQWQPNYMWYMDGEFVIYEGSFYKCLEWDTWQPPTNPEYWEPVPQWSAYVDYSAYDVVTLNGKLWETWVSNPMYPPGHPLDTDWYEISLFYTSYIPINYIPYNLDEVNMLEEYMGIGTDNPVGSWGGMMPFGAYKYGSSDSAAYFYGTFDFNGKCIKNLYMDYRGAESDSVINNCPNNNCFKSFVSRFRARNTGDSYDKFASSSPHFINPCIMAQKSVSVLYNHDTDSDPSIFPTRPIMSGNVTIENPFVLTETIQACAMSNHLRYQITGDVKLKNIKVVGLHLYDEGAGVISSLSGTCSLGDEEHDVVMGNIKIDGQIYLKRISSRTGLLCGGMEIGYRSTSNLYFPNVEIDVDIIAQDAAVRIDKNNTAALEDYNPGEIGFLIGLCRQVGGTVSFGNLSLSGKLIVNTQREYVTDISALIGKIETEYSIVFDKTVINTQLFTGSADKYLVCTDNVLGIITVGDLYFNSSLAGSVADEIGVPLTTDQMRKTTSFNLLDLKHRWQMERSKPVIRELTERMKTNTVIKNLYTGI